MTALGSELPTIITEVTYGTDPQDDHPTSEQTNLGPKEKLSLDYGDDLPDELKAQLRGIKTNFRPTTRSLILAILYQYGDLSVNQLIIGTYKIEKKTTLRNTMYSHLRDLRTQGLIERPEKAIYRLTDTGRQHCQKQGLDNLNALTQDART